MKYKRQEVKKQEAKYKRFVSTFKCNKQIFRIALTGCNAPSKVRVRYFEVLTASRNRTMIDVFGD